MSIHFTFGTREELQAHFGTGREVVRRALAWVPVGVTSMVLLTHVPGIAMLLALVLLATVASRFPIPYMLISGVAGLALALFLAAETASDRAVAYPIVLAGFGGLLGTYILVSLLGHDARRRDLPLAHSLGRSLHAGVAALALTMFVLSPMGVGLVEVPQAAGVPASVAGPLLVGVTVLGVTAVATRYERGYMVTGAVTLVALTAMAAAGTAYGFVTPFGVVGMAVFVLVATLAAACLRWLMAQSPAVGSGRGGVTALTARRLP